MRLHDFLHHRAEQRPDALFAIEGDRRLTFGDARRQVDRLAHAMARAGVDTGERVAVVAKNSIEFVLLYFAASKAGAVIVPINHFLPPPMIAERVTDSRAKIVFVGRELVSVLDELRAGMASVNQLVTLESPAPAGWIEYSRFQSSGEASGPEAVVTERDDLLLLYTSGTTGRPKGAVFTQQSVVSAVLQMDLELRGLPGDRWLVSSPLFHATAFIATAVQCAVSAGCMIIHREFNAAEVVKALDGEAIAFALMSPAAIRECLGLPGVEKHRFASLRALAYGVSPLGEATLRRAMEVFGGKLYQFYGTTEANGITVLGPDDHRRAMGDRPALFASAGRPLVATHVRIVDRKGEPVEAGGRGEIVVKAAGPMRGYSEQLEKAEASVRADDWLHTGDIGHLDEEGYVYVEDRAQDTIVSEGASIYPFEVEAAIRRHASVADVAVIGVPDPDLGEAVKAIVMLRPGAVAAAGEIAAMCNELDESKRPRSVDFVDSLPRNPLGRVIKRVLRAQPKMP